MRYRSVALLGLLLALTLAACVRQPAPFTYDLDVLYFVDTVVSADGAVLALEAFEAAHTALSVTYTIDPQDFVDALADDPDLIIVFNQGDYLPGDFLDAIVDWIDGGGAAVVADWTWTTDVLDALEVTWVDTNHASITFDDTRLGAGVTSPLVLDNPGWGVYSTGLATTTGVVAASFDNDTAAVVYGNDGRTAAVGLLNDVIADADDAEAFFSNLFDLMMKGTAVP
jgi:hypothetical protein